MLNAVNTNEERLSSVMRVLLVMSLLSLVMLAACGSSGDLAFSSLPEGDAVRGETLFHQSNNGTPACSSCHRTDSETLVGPGMAGFAERGATRVEGLSAGEYAFESIRHPSRFVVSGFGNLMYAGYSGKLSNQELADLIAYLLTL